MKKAVVIFSGGQDSTTCLGWSTKEFDEVIAISFKYGQKHENELRQAKKIANRYNIEHHIIDVSFFGELVESALTHNGDVNSCHPTLKDLPASYVPNRNALFLTITHAFAQKVGAEYIVTGVSEADYSGYPDCRETFIKSMEEALTKSSEISINIITPLMYMNKAEVFKLAENVGILGTVITTSLTCYNGDTTMHDWGMGCNNCEACRLRKKGYLEYKNKER